MSYETAPVRGVLEHYGRRVVREDFGGSYGTKGGTTQAVYTYSFDNLPAANADNLTIDIPAYAKIVAVYTEVLEEVTGLTGATVQVVAGSYDSGADALSAQTRGGAVKDVPATPTSVGATDAEVVVTLGGTGSATGGKLRTIVEYMPEKA